jgi:hypothetical protein
MAGVNTIMMNTNLSGPVRIVVRDIPVRRSSFVAIPDHFDRSADPIHEQAIKVFLSGA